MNAYYTLGRSGLRVSPLALGTMTFGTEWGWGADKATARQLFDTYLAAGGNFFDTADAYTGGTSETWLGEFVRDAGARDKAVIATKFSYNAQPGNPNAGGNGRKNIIRAVEGSLKRLGTDYIDLYLLHTWDQITPPEEVLRAFDDLVTAGKIRYAGLSDVPAWYAARMQTLAEAHGRERMIAMQMEYSLVERSIEDEFVPLGQALGMGVMVWSPLASGLLSGKYKPSEDGSNQGRLDAMRNTDNPAFAKFTERNWNIVAELEAVASEVGRSMAQVAVHWAATQPGIGSVIVGATKLHQLEDNLGALDLELTPEQRARLDAASAPAKRFPYTFFGPEIQSGLTGGVTVGSEPVGYRRPV
ncbi:MAG: aldo/keto reductase, partial [Bacteroidota bacterium]